jgi:outer membrane protein
MKKLVLLSTVVALGISATAAFAEMKIAVLDLNKVISSDPQVTTLQNDLKKKFDPRSQEIVAAQKKMQADIDAYNKDNSGGKLKGADLKQAQQKIIDEQKKVQDLQNAFQKDLVAEQNKSMQVVLKKVEDAVTKIAQDQKFDLVITKVSTAYSDPKLEITDQVVAAIKK